MTPDPTIRPAVRADTPILGALVRRAAPQLVHMHGSWDHRLGVGATFDDPVCLVAELDAAIVGCAWVDPGFTVDYGMPLRWWLFNVVAVDPLHQRRGIGRRLVAATIEHAAANPVVERLVGQCEARLVGWYLSQGFRVLGVDEELPTGLRFGTDVVELSPDEGNCWVLMDFDRGPPP